MTKKESVLSVLDARIVQAKDDLVSAQHRLNHAQELRASLLEVLTAKKKKASKPALLAATHHREPVDRHD